MLKRVRTPIFYGWYIVAVAVLAQFVTGGTQAYAISVFVKPMTEDLGWTRGSFSSVQTVSTVVMGVAGFFIGGLVDRRGPRVLLLGGGILAGFALCAISWVQEPWQFWLLRGIGQTLGAAMAGNMVVNVTVAKWFVARRGMAIAIASLGFSLGGVLLTPLTSVVVEMYGWRTAWVVLGVMVWIGTIPSVLVIRRSPESMGLEPDGMTANQAQAYAQNKRTASSTPEVQWTRPEALRTSAIWLVIAAYGLGTVGIGALFLHLVPFLIDMGFGSGTSTILFGVQAWASLISKPVWGVLMDRFHARYLSAFGFALCAVTLLFMFAAASTHSVWIVGALLFVYGFGIGGIIPLQETVWASYFGREHLGSIRSIGMPFTIIFGGGGPLLAGVMYDRTGSYGSAFVGFAVVQMIGVVLLLLAAPPRHPSTRTARENERATAPDSI